MGINGIDMEHGLATEEHHVTEKLTLRHET